MVKLKTIQGNFNNHVSFISTLLAKRYIMEKYGVEYFDAAEKPQGAPGIDIDIALPDGRRLVAEIKSTSPYKENDLGAKQKQEFEIHSSLSASHTNNTPFNNFNKQP